MWYLEWIIVILSTYLFTIGVLIVKDYLQEVKK